MGIRGVQGRETETAPRLAPALGSRFRGNDGVVGTGVGEGRRRPERASPLPWVPAFAGTTVGWERGTRWGLAEGGPSTGSGRTEFGEVPASAGTTVGLVAKLRKGVCMVGLPELRPYQLEIGRAIYASVWRRRGRMFTVEIARQGGKNELSAQLRGVLLLLLRQRQGREDGEGGADVQSAGVGEPSAAAGPAGRRGLRGEVAAGGREHRAGWSGRSRRF